MLRNYMASALRNLSRNRFYTAVNIGGLALGLAAALLIALCVRDELTYEHGIPGFAQVYRIGMKVTFPGSSPDSLDTSLPELAALMKLSFPSIDSIARVTPGYSKTDLTDVRHNQIEGLEKLYWADPSLFVVLPLKTIAGSLRTALSQPDGLVITRSLARKYFGRDDPIGEVLEISRHVPMIVRAVLEDLSSNTHLDFQIIAAGSGAESPLLAYDHMNFPEFHLGEPVVTYLRLKPGASIEEIERGLPLLSVRRLPWWKDLSRYLEWIVLPISALHMAASDEPLMRASGDPSAVRALEIIGILIVIIAGMNFVNLMTARAMQRSTEVGVRKASGASRLQLAAQFMCEALLLETLALFIAMALVELLLPTVNAFLGRTMTFDYWGDPLLAAFILSIWMIVGALSSIYPAFILSSSRANDVIQGRVRQGLVVGQFSLLIGLVIATVVVYQQTAYAAGRNLNLHNDTVLMVRAPCQGAFREEMLKLQGVRQVTCSESAPMKTLYHKSIVESPGGPTRLMEFTSVDANFFDFYHVKPLFGRLFSAGHPADTTLEATDNTLGVVPAVVLNESAARAMGFAAPGRAVGRSLYWKTMGNNEASEIAGIVPDLPVRSIREPVNPTIYVLAPGTFQWLNVALAPGEVAPSLKEIDRLWSRLGEPHALQRVFLDDHIESIYRDLARQAQLLAAFSGVALLIACLGLLGLASFMAEQRTKEIGIRKAMGASTGAVARLLVRQFVEPVIWASLIAWPIAAYSMKHWLGSFAYRIALEPRLFPVVTSLTMLIALATVGVQAWRVARANPVAALRYE
jgi:putative ABC transport system permease protein